jgi:hypothetical protein
MRTTWPTAPAAAIAVLAALFAELAAALVAVARSVSSGTDSPPKIASFWG